MSLPFHLESARARTAQRTWADTPIRDRLRVIREFRHLLVERCDPLTAAVEADLARPPDEMVATDVLPTASAAQFLERHAARILKPRRVGWRPMWLMGCRDVVHRRPHGVVGVIGTWNYPLFLNAVPILHAVAAGNAVLWKPSENAPRFAEGLTGLFHDAGFPPDLIVTLPATREAGPLLAEADVDFVHFTGSDAVGRKLAARLGERLIPSALELSGCDAVFVLNDADVELAARAAWYGATLNRGQTCMAVRRAYVAESVYERFVRVLRPLAERSNPMPLATVGQAVRAGEMVGEAKAAGCQVAHRAVEPTGASAVPPTLILNPQADELSVTVEPSFAPLLCVTPFADPEEALQFHAACAFKLTAAVFTRDPTAAQMLAARLHVGAVVVNDVIVPTAHPGTPFGGRGASGWGVTQGDEGLFQMTVPQVVTVRTGKFRPHIDTVLNADPAGGDVTGGMLALTHGRTLGARWRGLTRMIGGMRRFGKKA